MMVGKRRSTSRIDISDYHTLFYGEQEKDIDVAKNYFLSQSPPPMTYRDLRSVMSNKIPSNIVILPESSTSPSNTITSQHPRKSAHRKRHKRQGIDVYRSLIRTDSRCSALSDRDATNDDMIFLANSFVIDHITPSPTSGFFHPQNLPKIHKHRINTETNRIESGHTKSSYSSSPSLRIQHVGQRQPIPPQLIHRTSPVDVQYEENNHEMTITTTVISPPIPKTRTRVQLHVYMPQIVSC